MQGTHRVALLLLLLGGLALGWHVLGPAYRQRALAEAREALPRARARVWDSGVYDERGHERMGAPRPGEWLATNEDAPQTFEDYLAGAPRRLGHEGRRAIVLQPLEPMAPEVAPVLEAMRRFTRAFFGVEVRLAQGVALPASALLVERAQYDASALLTFLDGHRGADALTLAGICDRDLTCQDMNFVFGLAWLKHGVGVWSLTRLRAGDPPRELLLRRALGTLGHEVAHTFDLWHCIYWRCILNGSNSLVESDRGTLHLCPLCLRKLQHALGFDVRARYRALAELYAELGLRPEAAWCEERLRALEREGRAGPWRE